MTLRRSTIYALAGIFAAALAVRAAWTVWMDPIHGAISDPGFYNAAALSIAGGDGYSVATTGGYVDGRFEVISFARGGDATAFWPPGFSFVLGIAYAIFGESINVARGANVIAGALVVMPVFFIGRRLFGNTTGLVGAGIAAFLPSFVFWTPLLWSETMFTLVFASSVALLLCGTKDHGAISVPMLIAVGLVTGLAALFRGQALLTLPMAFLWLVLSGVRWRPAAMGVLVMTLAAAVMLVPWTVRNAVQMDSPIVLSTNAGYNLRVGHAPYSTGRFIEPVDLWLEQPDSSFQEREKLFNSLGRERALDYAFTHPADELELAWRKIMWLWRPDSNVLSHFTASSNTRDFFRLLLDLAYFALLLAAGAALLLGRVARSPKLFAVSFVMLWTLAHIAFFGEPRFHIPMLAVVVPLGGAAVAAAVDMLSAGEDARAGA